MSLSATETIPAATGVKRRHIGYLNWAHAIDHYVLLIYPTVVIGLQDMMKRADAAGKATQEPFTFFLFVAGMYLLFTSVSILLIRWVEKRYSVGVKAGEF